MSNIVALIMPTWGMSMTEGKVISWLKKTGAAIEKGDELVGIETTKITGVCEAHEGGLVLRKIVAQPDETLPCGALLGVAADASVPDSEIDAFAAGFQPEDAAAGAEGGIVEKQMLIDEVTLNVIIAGQKHNTKVPLLLVHGFGGNSGNWSLTLSTLAQKRPVIAIDLPGHGKSTKAVATATPEAFAILLGRAMLELGYSTYHVTGHSLGGLIAGMIASKNPAAIKALVLVDPAGVSKNGTSSYVADFVAAQDRRSLKAVMEQLVENTDLISRSMVAEVLDYRRLEGVQPTLAAIAGDIEARTGTFSALPVDLAARTLVIWGERDKIFHVNQINAFLTGVKKQVVPGVGHMAHIEWKEFNRTLSDFIATQE